MAKAVQARASRVRPRSAMVGVWILDSQALATEVKTIDQDAWDALEACRVCMRRRSPKRHVRATPRPRSIGPSSLSRPRLNKGSQPRHDWIAQALSTLQGQRKGVHGRPRQMRISMPEHWLSRLSSVGGDGYRGWFIKAVLGFL